MKMMQSPRYHDVVSTLAQKVALRYSLKQEAVQLQDEVAKLRAEKKKAQQLDGHEQAHTAV
eukprot:SAG11_NODE_26649_length_342_cov_1.279835_2_plen_61_part_01